MELSQGRLPARLKLTNCARADSATGRPGPQARPVPSWSGTGANPVPDRAILSRCTLAEATRTTNFVTHTDNGDVRVSQTYACLALGDSTQTLMSSVETSLDGRR